MKDESSVEEFQANADFFLQLNYFGIDKETQSEVSQLVSEQDIQYDTQDFLQSYFQDICPVEEEWYSRSIFALEQTAYLVDLILIDVLFEKNSFQNSLMDLRNLENI